MPNPSTGGLTDNDSRGVLCHASEVDAVALQDDGAAKPHDSPAQDATAPHRRIAS